MDLRGGRPRRPIAAVAAVLVVAAVAAIAWPRASRPEAWPSTGGVGYLDAGGEIGDVAPARDRPVGLAVLGGQTWMATAADAGLVRIHGGVRERLPLPGAVDALAGGFGALWVADGVEGTLRRVDPVTGRVVASVAVGNGPLSIGVGAGSVWVVTAGDSALVRVSPQGRVTGRRSLGPSPAACAFAGGSIWVADASSGTVAAYDARTLSPGPVVSVGGQPRALAAAGNGVWTANALDGTLSKIDVPGGRVVATVPVGRGVSALAASHDRLWAGDPAHSAVALLDGRTGDMIRRVRVEGPVSALAAAGARAWVTTLPARGVHAGGTLVLAGFHTPRTPHPGDPAANYTTDADALHAITNDGLLTYRRVAGAAGAAVVPDLAAAPPAITRGGRLWTFRLRRGIAFSTGRIVRPSDARATIARVLHMHPQALDEYLPLGIGGERACLEGRDCQSRLAVRADDAARTLTIRVHGSGRNLQLALAAPLFSILPAGMPPRPLTRPPFPATGPYRVSDVRPGRVVLTRNARYRPWSVDAQPPGFPDRIVWLDRLALARARDALGTGGADVLFSDLDAATIRAGTRAAPLRTVALPAAWLEMIGLRTQHGPFADARVRRAAALAAGRRALARALGPPPAMAVACGLIPQGLPGASPPCAGDQVSAAALLRARALVAKAGARGRIVDVLAPREAPEVERVLTLFARALRLIGLRTRVITGPRHHDAYFDEALRGRGDVFWFHWFAESPDPDEFLAGLLGCRRAPGAVRPTGWCDPVYDRMTARARALALRDAAAAAVLWQRADRRATSAAPLIPFANGRMVTAVSPRTGNVLGHPRYGILLDQLWVH